MTIKWLGTVCLVGLFAVFVGLPTVLVCGPSLELLAWFLLGVLVCYLLFAATGHHEAVQPMSEFHREEAADAELASRSHAGLRRKKAVTYALLAIVAWVPYVVMLLSLGWSGWWWGLAILFVMISVVLVLDLAGTVILNA